MGNDVMKIKSKQIPRPPLNDKEMPAVEAIMVAFNIPSDRMLTDKEVAKIKNCSVQTLRNNRHLRRGLSYYKDGRSIRYAGFDIAVDIYRSRIDPEAE